MIEIIKKPLLPEKNPAFVSRVINGMVAIVGHIVPIASSGIVHDSYVKRMEILTIIMSFREVLRGQGTYLMVKQQIPQCSQVDRRKRPKTFSIMECRWHL